MIFGHFRLSVIEVNAFIFACSETREALLVDVGEFSPSLKNFVIDNELNLKTIFITHDHYDHTRGVKDAAMFFDARVISGTPTPGGFAVEQVVRHGDSIRVGKMHAKVVDTPGHTPVGLSLIFPGTVFSGDALFAGSVGGTSNEEDHNLQIESIRKNLFTLPDDYIVHTGHGPSTTIGIEKNFNPFFV